MDSPLNIAPTDFLRSPLGIALLMLISTVGGGWLKDRLSTESREVSSTVRIDAIEHRLDDIRQDLRDIKLQIATRADSIEKNTDRDTVRK